jgi:hypothetical protein
MFLPTSKLRIQQTSGYTAYGQPKPVRWVTEACAVVRLRVSAQKTSVRADSSATRGAAEETEADGVLLLSHTTVVKMNDLLEVRGLKMRVTGIEPRYDLFGQHDHTEVHTVYWSQA